MKDFEAICWRKVMSRAVLGDSDVHSSADLRELLRQIHKETADEMFVRDLTRYMRETGVK